MAVFDQLQRASFGPTAFPVEQIVINGGLREHVHEYPHSPGGAPEKLGRKLYEVHMTANFQTTFKSYGTQLWPTDLNTLVASFEAQNSDQLVIPTVGTLQCYAVSWTRTATAKIRSGEKVELVFREDQADQNAFKDLITVSPDSLADLGTRFSIESDAIKPTIGLLDSIKNAANSVLGLVDQVNAQGNLLAAQLQGLVDLCAEADRDVKQLNDPVNQSLLQALHDLWQSALTLLQDLQNTGNKLVPFIVPATMAVGALAQLIYKDGSRGVDILNLNAISDPFAVLAGTQLVVYQP